ncbi:MAG: MATE family efflux transporter [Oscillospiraceae bacterium]|nr:MATE family efflux transporter [Oscillospiraceae bacterium]
MKIQSAIKISKQGDGLKTEPLPRLFVRMVIPAVISQLVTVAYNMVDRIYVGHIPIMGDIALTGLGVCMPVTIILSAFAQLAGFGGAPRVSLFGGAHDRESAERTLGSCALFAAGIGVMLTALALACSEKILLLFGASVNTLPYAKSYFTIYAAGTIFVELATGLAFFITAQGRSGTAMITVLLGAGINILLDPLFIFTLGLGVKGAAIATVLSQAVSCVWVLGFLFGRRGMVRLRFRYLRLDSEMLLPALALGLSPFVQILTESLTSVFFNRLLLRYGGDQAVGAMTIFATVMQFSTLPLAGIANGALPIISYNCGAGQPDRVRACCKLVLKTGLTYSVLLWLTIQIFPALFPGIFADRMELVAYSSSMIRTFFAMLWVMGAQVCCQLMFVALGNAKVSLFLALVRKIFLLIPLILLLPQILPDAVRAVYLAEPVADTLACIATVALFWRQFRQMAA